ncbi:MAG: acyl-CoA desaturase [Chitinophagaceae bacterium]|nr:MAG: acyl-CoA desaturase [Chitinophagaceae bacterium]
MTILIFFIALWYLSLFSQTFFLHRYAAHGSFKMSKGWEKFFYVFTWITQGSSYLSPRAYGIMHRMHHAFTDTEKDPHSPMYSKHVVDMMLKTHRVYSDIFTGKTVVEERFTKNVPTWRSFDTFAHSTFSRLVWVAAYLAFFWFFATSWWWYLLLPIVFSMGVVHGAIINWYAHKFGYINYKVKNTSMNLLKIDILMMGESYHNNHHKFPGSVNFGKRWHEWDPTYPVILFLKWLGIIKFAKPALVNASGGHDHDPDF